MIPLYLEAKLGMQVVLESPALSVVTLEKTRQLFPLSRISRVVVSGAVEWSMPALFACADAGISIVFLNDSAQVRCQWIGRSQKKSSLVKVYSDLLQRRDALQRYQNWLLAMRRMVARSSARRMGVEDWQEIDFKILEEWVLHAFNDDWLQVNRLLKAYLLSSVFHYLGDLGFDAECDFLVDGQFNLADDLTSLLLWDYYPALLVWSQRSSGSPDKVDVTRFYQQRCQRIDNLVLGLLNRLHQCLREGF
jgi:hypothetical protein